MKRIFIALTLAGLAFAVPAETVTRSDEMGCYRDSGVSSGFWDVSKRATPTYERTEESAATSAGYDARWYTTWTSSVFELFRGIPGMSLFLR